ncbi:MAG: histidine kinase dimerization/phospho-acceptor domain-containing protein [Anaerolineae bacterium]
MQLLKRWAELEEQDRSYSRKIAYIILISALIASGIITAAGLVVGSYYFINVGVVACVSCLFILWLTRQGRLAPVRLISPLFAFVVATYLVIANEGIHDEGLFIYPLTIVLAGLMLGRRGVVGYSVLSVGAVATLGYAETQGLIVNKFSASTGFAEIITLCTLLGFTGTLLYVTIDHLSRSLKRVRRSEEELTARVNELAALNRIAEAVATTLDLQAVLETVSEMIPPLFNAQVGVIGLLDPGTMNLSIWAHHSHAPNMPGLTGAVYSLASDPTAARVIETRQSVVVSRSQVNFLPTAIPQMEGRHVECLLTAPLQVHGAGIGVITIASNEAGREFTSAEVKLAETIAGQVAEAIDNARLFEQEQKAKQAAEEARIMAEQAQRAAEEARAAAETASEAKSVFLANMSHELRTPLNSIMGFAQLLAPASNLTVEQRKSLNAIGASGEHLLALINHVLALTRMKAGGAQFTSEDFDLRRVLQELGAQDIGEKESIPEPSLAGAPAEWLTELRQATIEGDLDRMASLADQIRGQNPALSNRLAELIYNFEHKRILELVEKAEGHTSGEG